MSMESFPHPKWTRDPTDRVQKHPGNSRSHTRLRLIPISLHRFNYPRSLFHFKNLSYFYLPYNQQLNLWRLEASLAFRLFHSLFYAIMVRLRREMVRNCRSWLSATENLLAGYQLRSCGPSNCIFAAWIFFSVVRCVF